MNPLKTVNEVDISYSKSQLYRRLEKLEETGVIEPQRGGRNQYLLDPEDVRVLQRLADLENGHHSVRTAIVKLENDLLREEVNELRNKNESLQHEIVARNNVIRRLKGKWFDKIRATFHSVAKIFK